jgi:hypothetical protein
MIGGGFFVHLGKDNFEINDVGIGRDLKKFKVKMLKKDMQEILKKYGRDDTGKKDEVIQKFVDFIGKAPKPEPIPEPIPEPKPRRKYTHLFSDVGYNADRYPIEEIMSLLAESNADTITEEQRQIKRLAINKIVQESRKKNKDYIGNWILNGERFNSKNETYHSLPKSKIMYK